MPSSLKTSGESLFTSGLNSSTEWGLYGYALGNITIATSGAPILIVYPVTSGYASGTTYDDQIANIIQVVTDYEGYGASYTYIPSGSSTLFTKCPHGCGIFHGSKRYVHKPVDLDVDHDGYVFVVTDVYPSYTVITKNGSTIDGLESLYKYPGNGHGVSYGAIPVKAGDYLTFTGKYHSVIY